MSVLGASNEQQMTLAVVAKLRQSAKSYRDAAARMSTKSAADRLLAMSREFEEEAARLEVKIILSRPIESTGG
jgi:hypothetical protein